MCRKKKKKKIIYTCILFNVSIRHTMGFKKKKRVRQFIMKFSYYSFRIDDICLNNNFGTSKISTSSLSSTCFNLSSGIIFLFMFGFCKLLSLIYFQAYFKTKTLDAVSAFKNSFSGLFISQSICNPFGLFFFVLSCFPLSVVKFFLF
ncbi:hypothetical protein PFDG_01204 [Plasmodium falciparum Dd2]|uniref:Uncharacterized protein n=1 Tax=Plasmodium falciparum (isolate Dd2) TaxID=57267 RepID=A0A0L7LYG7_PLAF4|nr:hypothetical protein PFDG_01204 [Plasmodium falciparum Dd2]